MSMVAERPKSLDMLASEERSVWEEYLRATRDQGLRYDEVEPWAWNRLTGKLTAIKARRAALAAPARGTS